MGSTDPSVKRKPPLFEFAYMGKFDEVLEQLKELSMVECWDYTKTPSHRPYPILFNYIQHTFMRIKEEGKIAVKENYHCFNTGLVTPNQEEIFILFKRNDSGKLFFVQFCKESDHNLVRFERLPERAGYFCSTTDLFFDHTLQLRINIDHIVEDPANYDRLPADIKSLPKHQLINTINGAIQHAKKRVKRNYKTAIPQYYRGYGTNPGQLQLLLPLCLIEPATADLALAIFKADNSYIGRTCLTLDMAINNARLIARPDDEWLKA